ncbi:isopentenyl phosphate kinase family protein [Candidatus Bathyarchaeota archaeon]|nr:MAG: isopentenyl phosphate kinase family protein [Candidatus Bathyarchaeota archaeon]TMI43465.1 MAG: isopentenyl phosphate kinase family protein [Candidatus Bathyarchaeota archaeon]
MQRMDQLTILKLGGSAITDKGRECTPDIPAIQRIADQLRDYNLPLILIHGGGSYAHPFVTRSDISRGLRGRSQLRSIAETEFYLSQLTRIICASLLLRNKLPVPFHPMSFVAFDQGTVKRVLLDPIRKALRVGLLPLLHGDLVFDESRGIGVLSGDRIASLVGLRLGASRVLLGCDVDGVYSENPKIFPNAVLIPEVTSENFPSVLRASRGPSSDATGGMGEKVRQALQLAKNGCECYIFNLKEKNALPRLLERDGITGTRFVPWKNSRKSSKQSRRIA